MVRSLFLICLFLSASHQYHSQNLSTPFELGNGNQTSTYQQMVEFYNALEKYPGISLRQFGKTDSGEPLLVVYYNYDRNKLHGPDKGLVLINNGIHPGEPDGIDASMRLLRDLALGKIPPLQGTSIAVIASYNVGGMLNRNTSTRVNQNGPEEYGFRGNARNFDLNRDFIKTDSRNAISFQQLYHELNPDFFIDNHVSNGADYQHILTYIATNKQRLGEALGAFYHDEMNPQIVNELERKGIYAIPYVNVWGTTPDKGYEQFMDSPRYATGYTSLFNTPGSVVETHMLKPYKDRVEVTYQNMLSHLHYLDKHWKTVKNYRQENQKEFTPGKIYNLQWQVDRSIVDSLTFRGYRGQIISSEITGLERLKYDRNAPYIKKIAFYPTYKPTLSITIPRYYVVPKSQWPVIEHLDRNKIITIPVKRDTVVTVESYSIGDFTTVKSPYEGHYLHSNVKVLSSQKTLILKPGDLLIPTEQPGVKYLLETLEPQGVDSFFAWNFFDSILGQKEHYSDYVFEDTAKELLEKDPELRRRFHVLRSSNSSILSNSRLQLDWIYKESEHYEKSHLLYPIFRIN